MNKCNIKMYLLLFLLSPLTGHSDTVEIYTINYPPYANKLTDSGYMIEIIKASFLQSGLKVKFNYLPFKRTKFMFLKTKGLLLSQSSDLQENEKKLVLSATIETSGTYLLFLKKMEKKLISSNYNNFTLGVLRGASDEVEISKRLQARIVNYNTMDSGLKMLILDRLDAIICLEILCNLLIEKSAPYKFGSFMLQLSTIDLIIHKDTDTTTKEQFELFKKGLIEIKKNGIYDKIRSQYF